jgi:hypothetical protein
MPLDKRIQRIRALNETLHMLNKSQGFALGEVTNSGGELAFVRETKQGVLAVVKVDGGIVTIDSDGEIDDQPDIKTREA